MEHNDLLDRSDDEFAITKTQDSPANFSKKIIKNRVYATQPWTLMPSTLIIIIIQSIT